MRVNSSSPTNCCAVWRNKCLLSKFVICEINNKKKLSYVSLRLLGMELGLFWVRLSHDITLYHFFVFIASRIFSSLSSMLRERCRNKEEVFAQQWAYYGWYDDDNGKYRYEDNFFELCNREPIAWNASENTLECLYFS